MIMTTLLFAGPGSQGIEAMTSVEDAFDRSPRGSTVFLDVRKMRPGLSYINRLMHLNAVQIQLLIAQHWLV